MTLCRENSSTEILKIPHSPDSKSSENLVNRLMHKTNPLSLVKEMEL